MFIYLASSPVFRAENVGKIGYTENPHDRRRHYLTGCPPGRTPSHDIEYVALWETTALTRDELFDCEEEVHNQFLRYRLMREIPGDSEWFDFKQNDIYHDVRTFLETRPWCKRQVSLREIIPLKRTTRYLRKQYHKNLAFLKSEEKRLQILNSLQEPIISAIRQFVFESEEKAGYVIAPCGSGKTRMTCTAILGLTKIIIICPSTKIQEQWKTTLSFHPIYFIGGNGTTNPDTITSYFKKDTYCILTTTTSSHLLVNHLTPDVQLLIIDEAHHMAGVVASEENGEGITRKLMVKACDLNIKRLSLTYTPRFVHELESDIEYLSMDDDEIFGKQIAELKIRNMINLGVLPDYRLWMLRDTANKGAGILGKAECLLEAWEATEMKRGQELPILNHLLVFTSTTQDAKTLEDFFQAKTTHTVVLRVEAGNNLDIPLRRFSEEKRAILINCFLLGEGVDIPCADSVAIMYPKQSRGQITQMILRAGRWYPKKDLFHIVLPITEEEDLSGFEEVLTALASCDEKLKDEIILRSSLKSLPTEEKISSINIVPECIVLEEFNATEEDIKRCFSNIRRNLFPAKESRKIQELCHQNNIRTSIEYYTLRQRIPELPEDPRYRGMTWFTFLNPSIKPMDLPTFLREVLEQHNLNVSHQYETWYNLQTPNSHLPSVQHINDGYFGTDITNFRLVCDKLVKKIPKRKKILK